jgi:hypothetical protein
LAEALLKVAPQAGILVNSREPLRAALLFEGEGVLDRGDLSIVSSSTVQSTVSELPERRTSWAKTKESRQSSTIGAERIRNEVILAARILLFLLYVIFGEASSPITARQ